jgi:putative transposase
MANTYTSLHYHIVFSTKNRQRWIQSDIEQRVWEYIGGIARENGMKALQVGGIEDHIHIALAAPPTMSVSHATQLIKGGSSKWIHETFSALLDFEWQQGYGAFSVSKSQLPILIQYIINQRIHHAQRSFETEYFELLDRHGVDYDEQYVLG